MYKRQGLYSAESGEIWYKDEQITPNRLYHYRRNQIGIVFQQYNLINYLTGIENVELAMTETDNAVPENRREIAYALLEKVGIVRSKAERPISKLSGGEQQRIAIARALAANVDLIFADEPTGNLDTATEQEIIRIFRLLAEDFGKTVIVVTHSETVSRFSDERVLLEDGQLHRLPPEAEAAGV